MSAAIESESGGGPIAKVWDMPSRTVPDTRIRSLSAADTDAGGTHVLYWMTSARRTRWNFALDRAISLARSLKKPLVILEALRVDYPWASDRLHRFVIQGMRANQAALAGKSVTYYPYVEPEVGAGKGLLSALARGAAAVVTDDFPCFFLPGMLRSAASQVDVRFEAVDSNGILPMRATDRVFARAFDFRRFLQRELPAHLGRTPRKNPLAGLELPRLRRLPADIARRWPAADERTLQASAAYLATLPLDHRVAAVETEGGSRVAEGALKRFVARLGDYGEQRNQPESEATSGLSPYLHFGHLSAHQVLDEIAEHEDWFPERVANTSTGKRAGWWNMSVPAEEFLDQLITWRELGYNLCSHVANYDRYESLPDWAQATLAEHEGDARPYAYTATRFERAQTHDELWNAAQNQLRCTGTMHNYLRMLWGKKILEWTSKHRSEALEDYARPEQPSLLWTVETRIPTRASSGCWAATTAPGVQSERCSARSATWRPPTRAASCA